VKEPAHPRRLAWLDAYHAGVLQNLDAAGGQETAAWLAEVTAPI
jgi:hypothetical protein